jgi:hypothetical protein
MAAPLKDFRTAIPEAVDMWLDAVAAANRIDKAQVARDVLQDWADKKAHEHRLYARRARANGLQLDLAGFDEEEDGAPRKGAARR